VEHANSGIVSLAFALMVDGGEFNRRIVQGIGLDKAAAVIWRAQSLYLSPVSDFRALATSLSFACQTIRAAKVPIYRLRTTALAPGMVRATLPPMSAHDCLQVRTAVRAVEMRKDSPCAPQPSMDQSEAPVYCAAGSIPPADPELSRFLTSETVGHQCCRNLFHDTFHTSLLSKGWNTKVIPSHVNSTQLACSRRQVRNWEMAWRRPPRYDLKRGSRGQWVVFCATPMAGDCREGQIGEARILRLTTPSIRIPSSFTSSNRLLLGFSHYFALEKDWDGANLKLHVNGADPVLVPSSVFQHNPYPSSLLKADDADGFLSTNPLQGEPAFTGGGSLNSQRGLWVNSQVELHLLDVKAGDTLEVTWEVGTDACTGW
jgi:hypothetical protein